MIKRLLLLSTVCFSLTTQAGNLNSKTNDSISVSHSAQREQWLHRLEPTYIKNVTLASGVADNWFIGIGGGASAFAGSPLGCEDLFGRIKPTLNIQVGKWFTPAVGARVSFQGFDFKNSELQTMGYKLVHADLMFDVASYMYKVEEQPRWGVVPFVGLGLIHNEEIGNNPFCFSYGVMGRYRLSQRLHLTMELGGTTTFKDFDGHGASQEFGDNLVGINAGLSLTLGKTGWKKVVDAEPYIAQNDWLIKYSRSMEAEQKLCAKALSEMRKILEIEGLLDYYSDLYNKNQTASRTYPKNDYNGLNSLMARIGKGNKPFPKSKRDGYAKKENVSDSISLKQADEQRWNDYFFAMCNNHECIGSPIYFFFKINTNDLTDPSQLINLDELVRVAKKYNLHVRITGAADSATGTADCNDRLSVRRADYVSEQLIARGLNADCITKLSLGGVSEHLPAEGNRNTKVELVFEC